MLPAITSTALKPKFLDEDRLELPLPAGSDMLWEGNVELGPESLDHGVLRAPAAPSANALLAATVSRAQAVVERFPDRVQAQTSLGMALLSIRDLDGAAAAFTAASELNPNDRTAILYRARILVLQGRLDEARKLYMSLRGAKRDALVLAHLADLAMRSADLDGAATLWQQALNARPSSAIPHANLGAVLLALNRPAEAVAHFRAASRLVDRSPGLFLGLGVAQARTGQIRRAIRSLEASVALAPGMAASQLALASILATAGELERAYQVLSHRIKQEPADWRAIELLAQVEYQRRRFRQSSAWLRKALDVTRLTLDSSETPRLLNNLAVSLWSDGRHPEAERVLRESVAGNPSWPIPYHNLARLLIELQRASEANSVLEEALDRFPGDDTASLLTIAIEEVSGRYDKAIQDLLRWVLDRNRAAPAQAWSFLGQLLTDAKHQADRAVPILRVAHQRFPQDAVVANNLAYTLLMLGDADEARPILESTEGLASSRDPVAATVLAATRGLLHLVEGNRLRADLGYSHAVDIARANGLTYLAKAAEQKKHLEFARSYLRESNAQAAGEHLREGLRIDGYKLYRRDLESLAAQLSP